MENIMRNILAVFLFLMLSVTGARAEEPEMSTPSTPAMPAHTFSDAEKLAIQEIIKNYITKEHPEILIDASRELERRDDNTAKDKTDTAIKSSKDKIFEDPSTPVGGNPKGDVTIVEFFDYQCGFCKLSEPEVQHLLKDDKNIRYIYKDFPVLGSLSVTAAQASLASIRQHKFFQFHDALIGLKGHLNEALIYSIAADAGLNVDQLKKDMQDDAISAQIQANIDLGKKIGVRGTPMFIIGDSGYPGALDYDQLKKAVESARAAPVKK